MRKQLLLISFCVAGFFILKAEVIHVPQDFSKIQDAIDASVNSDTILVDEGTYFENLNYKGKNVVVASQYIIDDNTEHILNTIIDGRNGVQGDTASCVAFVNGEDSNAVIQGFTLQNGKSSLVVNDGYSLLEGGGIIVYNASPTIKNNVIINNTAGAGGGGIAVFNESLPNIYNNIIAFNKSSYAGGIVLNWSGGIIRNNIVYKNRATNKYGSGGVMVWDVGTHTAIVENNTIVENRGDVKVGGFSTNKTGTPIVRNNIIRNNTQNSGDEFALTATTVFEYNNVANSVTGTGNITTTPEFSDIFFQLKENSAGVDEGDPDTGYNDVEDAQSPGNALSPSLGTVRNDIGAFGGPLASSFPDFSNKSIIVKSSLEFNTSIGFNETKKLIIGNMDFNSITIDSIKVTNEIKLKDNIKLTNYQLQSFKYDTIDITIIPEQAMEADETLMVYHNCDNLDNPFRIPVSINVISATTELKSKNRILLFPNPAKEDVTIQISSDLYGMEYQIYNIQGKLMDSERINQEQIKIDVSAYKKGIYLLLAGNEAQKLIIK